MAKTTRKPRGLDATGSRLWERITAEFDMDSEPQKLAILETACRTADDIARYESAADLEPLCVKGSANQLVIHPLRSEIRFSRGLLSQLLARLNFEDQDNDYGR